MSFKNLYSSNGIRIKSSGSATLAVTCADISRKELRTEKHLTNDNKYQLMKRDKSKLTTSNICREELTKK